MNDKANFLDALEAAGYTEDRPQDITSVTELPDRFVFIHIERTMGSYTVGEFFKATPTKHADFAGVPLAICNTYEEANRHLNNFIQTIIA